MTFWSAFDIMTIECFKFWADEFKDGGERVVGVRFGTELDIECTAYEIMFDCSMIYALIPVPEYRLER